MKSINENVQKMNKIKIKKIKGKETKIVFISIIRRKFLKIVIQLKVYKKL